MTALLAYLLQSIICSGILYCFYRVAYFNRLHHQWNRFYLAGSIVVSLLLPLIKIPIPVVVTETSPGVIQLLNIATTHRPEAETVSPQSANSFNADHTFLIAYLAVSAFLLIPLLNSLVKLFSLYTNNPKRICNGVEMVITNEKNSPFSFWKTIFWNINIDPHSTIGQRIFEHEKTHVQHLHSIDRLLMNIVAAVFWCNPFFWLIKKEMILVHEFIADKKAVRNNSPEAFSEMLLTSAFPTYSFTAASSLVTSSLARRVSLLTRSNNSKTGRFGQWMLLPVILVLFAGFTFRKQEVIITPTKPFTVMIDAGHGGMAKGATSSDGTQEKDLTLMIAKTIKDLNKNDQINVIMSRDEDADVDQRARVEMAGKMKVDAFISVHINSDPSGQSGMQLIISKNSSPFAAHSQLLGSCLSNELKKVYAVDGQLRRGPADRGVWVLDAPEISYPSILIECGNMRNESDLAFVKSTTNQQKIAQHILNAIRQFADRTPH